MTILTLGHLFTQRVIGSDNGILHLEVGIIAGLAVGLHSNDVAVSLARSHKRLHLLLQLRQRHRLVVTEQCIVVVKTYLEHVAAVDVL